MTVGFDYNLRLHQLDFIAREMVRVPSVKELYQLVEQYLMSDIAGSEARKKARTVLFKTWVKVPPEHTEVRDLALKLFPDVSPEERLILHWGLILMAYPFFRDMAEQAGRLLHIQGEFSSLQIGRKMRALYGEREKVKVGMKKILQTWRDFQVIAPKGQVYVAKKHAVAHPALKQWLCEAYLRATGKAGVEINRVDEEMSLFPFAFTLSDYELKGNERLQLIYGQGTIQVGIRESIRKPWESRCL
ncbi:hypothetical protein BSNK01_07860 [Bacillaceae bacterium]